MSIYRTINMIQRCVAVHYISHAFIRYILRDLESSRQVKKFNSDTIRFASTTECDFMTYAINV